MHTIASAEAVHGAHGTDDLQLMLLVAFLLSYAVLDAACRVRAAHGTGRTLWLVGGSLVVGLGIFAFHFVALLSVGLPLPLTADPMTFGVSAVTAIVAAGGALHHVNRGVGSLPPFAISAGLKGFALVATHYTSMAALHVPAQIAYDPAFVIASIVIAVGVSAAALWLAERLRAETPGRAALERAAGALVMAIGLIAMHSISAKAGRFVPDPGWGEHATAEHVHHLPEVWLLPWVVGAGTIAVVGLAIAATISRRSHHRERTSPTRDRLTGLPNGVLLRERLTDHIADGDGCTLVIVRLRRFEQLKTRLGRRDTDCLLARVGQRIHGASRPEDLVARLGDSEFAVLVRDGRESVGDEIAHRIADRITAPIRVGDLLVVAPALVGAATTHDGETAADLLRAAQLAAQRSRPVEPLGPAPNPRPIPGRLRPVAQAA
jgi:diguanylate cyclase (GGDEF)-like protein